MNELTKAGANHPKNDEENKCKTKEDKNTVQADLFVRKRQVYPKKPRLKKTQETLTPDQLVQCTTKKTGSTHT